MLRTSGTRASCTVSASVFDHLDLVTYEEVVKRTSFRRKTLVLLGKCSSSQLMSASCPQPAHTTWTPVLNLSLFSANSSNWVELQSCVEFCTLPIQSSFSFNLFLFLLLFLKDEVRYTIQCNITKDRHNAKITINKEVMAAKCFRDETKWKYKRSRLLSCPGQKIKCAKNKSDEATRTSMHWLSLRQPRALRKSAICFYVKFLHVPCRCW